MAERILIADDDVETLRLVGMMLQRQGFEIIAANNGAQGLAGAKNSHPDLIILDIMMPDMDGYQVCRLLRQDPDTSDIPILMFTAKNQAEDKVTGYEAGANDYLTKPIHPAELVARVKSLLARTKSHTSEPPAERGYMIAVVTPKGGLGSSTLALNLAISYAQRTHKEVISAEVRPGLGVWAEDLAISNKGSLENLLRRKSFEIKPEVVDEELQKTTFSGLRLLMASSDMSDTHLAGAFAQLETLLQTLPLLAPMVILDIGLPVLAKIEKLLTYCDEVILITEPYPATLRRTQKYIQELGKINFGKSKLLTLVMLNRVRADFQISFTQAQEILGQMIAQVIPPAPEIAYQSALQYLPLVKVQPDSLIAQQYRRLAEIIAQRKK